MVGSSFLAVDIGTESGRGISGRIQERLRLEEIHRVEERKSFVSFRLRVYRPFKSSDAPKPFVESAQG
jgi:hypothetical protein